MVANRKSSRTGSAEAAAALQLLGDDTRRAIVEQLANGPLSVGELAARLPVSRPAVSQHLGALKAAGPRHGSGLGTRRIYRLDPARPATCCGPTSTGCGPGLEGYQDAIELTTDDKKPRLMTDTTYRARPPRGHRPGRRRLAPSRSSPPTSTRGGPGATTSGPPPSTRPCSSRRPEAAGTRSTTTGARVDWGTVLVWDAPRPDRGHVAAERPVGVRPRSGPRQRGRGDGSRRRATGDRRHRRAPLPRAARRRRRRSDGIAGDGGWRGILTRYAEVVAAGADPATG